MVYPLVLALGLSLGVTGCKKEEETYDTGVSIESAVRTDIENVYTAKGKIISGQESSMNVKATSSQDAIIIDQVYVSVGDEVKAGDVLYTIDTTQAARDLALKEEQQAISDQQNAIKQEDNERALSNAQADSGDQYVTGTRNLVRNADDTNQAIDQQLQDQEKLQSYKDEETRTKAAYDSWQAQVNSLQSDYDSKNSHLQELNLQLTLKNIDKSNASAASASTASSTASSGSTQSVSDEYKKLAQEASDLEKEVAKVKLTVDEANTALTQAKTSLAEAKTAYETAKAQRETYEKTVTTDQKSTTDSVRKLEDQGDTVNKDNRTKLTAEQTARNAIASQDLSHKSDTITNEAEIAKLKEKLENGQVIATMDGTVTAVNVTAGTAYSGSDGVVLDNLSKMKVSADIDEGHIADLKVGTRVRVKTDSTGTQELTGTVTFTSPTPTKETSNNTNSSNGSTSSSSSNNQNTKTRATYKVEVTLDEPNDRLRIGMTATIDFIVASAENVIAVPSTCLIDDGNGNYFVNVVSSGTDAEGAGSESTGGSIWEDSTGSAGTASETEAGGDAAGIDAGAEGSVTQVMVTTGVTGDYYTEITSGNIREGEQLQAGSSAGNYSDMLDGLYATGRG